MCRNVHVERPRVSTSEGQSFGGMFEDGVEACEKAVAKGDGEVEVDVVEEGEADSWSRSFSLIMAVHAATEVHDRHLMLGVNKELVLRRRNRSPWRTYESLRFPIFTQNDALWQCLLLCVRGFIF